MNIPTYEGVANIPPSMIPIKRQHEENARRKFVNHGLFCEARTIVANKTGMSKTTKNAKLGRYAYRPTPVLISLCMKGPII